MSIVIQTTRYGTQLHKNDPLGSFLARLREERKIWPTTGIPQTSRFYIDAGDLNQVVFPTMAKLLGEDASKVRFPTEIEFNILGNFIYTHFGEADTSEWVDDIVADSLRLHSGNSSFGDLTPVGWSLYHKELITFRPLVVVSPKA